jgi:DNA-binding NtrC family response regulator
MAGSRRSVRLSAMDSRSTPETILVVDESESVCEVIEILLGRAGYRVLAAAKGTQALDLARDTPEIDLLMTSLDLPGMRGNELASRIAVLQPEAGVVFLSHHEFSARDSGPFETLTKPFTVAQLRDTVRRALRARRRIAEATCAA